MKIITKRLHLFVSLLICSFTILVNGCTVGRDFKTPEVPLPKQWTNAVPECTSAQVDLTHWWTIFKDPVLETLINRAVRENLDLKLAGARIWQARAERKQAGAAMGPTVSGSGSYQRQEGENSTAELGSQSPTPAPEMQNTLSSGYIAGFDAGWEIDLFGGLKRQREVADADLEAAIEAQRNTLVSLLAEVARLYINLRVLQKRNAIALMHLEAQGHSAKLTRQRYESGLVSALDVNYAEAQAADTAAKIPLLEASIQKNIYKLGILLGGPPDMLLRELTVTADLPEDMPLVPVGLPSQLLRRRPDIRMAEANVHAATARIGVAVSELFPKLTLTGSISYLSDSVSTLFSPASLTWLFSPSMELPIFDSGRTRAQINVSNAQESQTVIAYRQTVMAALLEVENALISAEKEVEHRKALKAAVTANREAVRLAKQLYTAGETDFLQVLVAEQSLYTKEDALVQSSGSNLNHLVALYKALGGGWTPSDLPSSDNQKAASQ